MPNVRGSSLPNAAPRCRVERRDFSQAENTHRRAALAARNNLDLYFGKHPRARRTVRETFDYDSRARLEP